MAEEGESREGTQGGDPSPQGPVRESAKDVVRKDISPLSSQGMVERLNRLRLEAINDYNELRRAYGDWTFKLLAGQLLVVNLLFALYFFRRGLNPDPDVFKVFIASTFVEIVGIVLVVTRSLFPKGGGPIERSLFGEDTRDADDDKKKDG